MSVDHTAHGEQWILAHWGTILSRAGSRGGDLQRQVSLGLRARNSRNQVEEIGSGWAQPIGPRKSSCTLRLEEGSGEPSKDQGPKLVPAKSLQSGPTLCGPMDCSPPGSSVHETLQAGVLGWVAMLSSRGFSWPKDQTRISMSPALAGRFSTIHATQSWGLTLSAADPMLVSTMVRVWDAPVNFG